MRLTRCDKTAFVRAVMADVPRIDYREKMQTTMMNYITSHLPVLVKAVWDSQAIRRYIYQDKYYSFPNRCGMSGFRGPETNGPVSEIINDHVLELAGAHKKQVSDREDIETSVAGLIYGCSTLKKAREIISTELHKYLPANRDSKVTANVPVVCNVVSMLTKSGWKADDGDEEGV